MIYIETFYLIDYENVHGDGLSGCQSLGKTDHIVIFFTRNSKNIDMSDISNHGSAVLDMIEVPAGKQSADMHIGSYLGYLAGKNGNNCNVVIVSKDTDFDNVIKFWKQKTGIEASRTEQIKKKPAPKPQTSKQKSEVTKKPVVKVDGTKKTKLNKPPKNNDITVSSKDRTTTNSEIQKILSKAGFSKDTINNVASTVVKNLGQKDGKEQTYRSIIDKYGQILGLNIYNHIKKYI